MKRSFSPETSLRTIKYLSISDLKCKNRVFSNQIFKNILIPIFAFSKEPYCLAYGDFNGLDKFNRRHSTEAGTQAIVDSISAIQKHMPEDTITVRIAGDEFIFISSNQNADNIRQCMDKASEVLKSDKNKYLTMSMGIADSEEFSNIYDMYTVAEQRESSQKLTVQETEYSKEIMKKKLDENFNSFFNNYRFANKMELKGQHISQLGELAIKSALDLIVSDEFRDTQLVSKNNNAVSTLVMPTVPLFTPEQANSLFSYLDDAGEDKLNDLVKKLYPSQINKFFKELIINPNSNFLNGTYYDLFFKPKLDLENYRPATIISLDVTDIKDCNTKTSHLETDQKLAELASEMQDHLRYECGIEFDNDISSFDESHNYIFNKFAGEFLILLGEKSLSQRELFYFLTAVNATNILPMHVISSYSTDRSLTYNESMKKLEEQLLINKSGHLLSSLTSYQTKESMDLFISDSVDFFVKNCPTSSDMNSQKEFFGQMITSLTEQAIKSNKEFRTSQEKKTKKDNRDNDSGR